MLYGGGTVKVGVWEEMESRIDLIHERLGETVHLAHRSEVMNEINARLIQHLAITNPPPPITPVIEEVDRSHRSHRAGDQDSKSRHSTGWGHSTRSRVQRDHGLEKLTPRTIDSFGYLSKLFVANFITCMVKQKNASHLFTIHQNEGESLKDYVKRFNQAILEVDCVDTPSMADKYIAVEELVKAKRRRRGRDDHKRKEFETQQVDYRDEYVAGRPQPDSSDRRYGDNRPIAGNIQIIHRGFGLGRSSSSSRKRHAKQANGRDEEEVYNLSMPITEAHQTIAFTNDNLKDLHLPYDDTLVVSATIANFNGDIPGIDPQVTIHRLFTNPDHPLVHQKRRKFSLERLKVVEEEVSKLIKASVIREAHYPNWLANIIVAPKKGGKIGHKMFKEMIGKMMEVYVDDMLVKTLKVADHITHLEETFGILRRHRMMLNPSKCILGVSLGKFLGFLVTKRGIEANPDQIQAQLAMSSPRNIHE
ncbi:hypothetical protein Acr_00g0068130 [Actinidia rufa]|uniref:Retrotransposon gag domain-containing protein n=1 Tax=Actinidia rufa TaxID=165716 RepID=A0A7J0DSQ9_9ERIC|nr:hypothetical protein Acr_00g0068130 [Actinidia rufa]